MSINLLPEELKPKSTTLKASKKLRKVSILMLTIFVIAGIIVGGVILVFNNLISISEKTQSNLKNQITSLGQTETRLVLIKDRLSKIEGIEKSGIVDQKAKLLRSVYDNMPSGVIMSGITLDKNGIEIKINFRNSDQLGELINKLNENGGLTHVRMNNLKYNTIKGYEVELTLI